MNNVISDLLLFFQRILVRLRRGEMSLSVSLTDSLTIQAIYQMLSMKTKFKKKPAFIVQHAKTTTLYRLLC